MIIYIVRFKLCKQKLINLVKKISIKTYLLKNVQKLIKGYFMFLSFKKIKQKLSVCHLCKFNNNIKYFQNKPRYVMNFIL